MVGVVVLVGILFAGFGFTGMTGDVSAVLANNQQLGASNSNSRYITRERWVTVDNSYIDPQYKQLFEKLDLGTAIPGSADGFNVDYQNVTADNWSKFCKLSKESDEFNTYAGQLLYSQYQNSLNIEQSNKDIFCNIRDRYEYGLILKSLGLKEQDGFNISHKDTTYRLTDWYAYNKAIEEIQYEDIKYEELLNSSIQSGNFFNNEIHMGEHVNFYDVITKTVNGSLKFWDYKQNKNFDEYKGKQPLKLSNGGQRCWVQAGAQILISSTANDDLSTLGNWGKFVRKLADIQAKNRNGTIEFLDVLKSFCSSNEFDFEEITKAEVNNQLKLLEKGGTAQTATGILLNIFPKLKQIKFDTKKVIFEQPCDPILSEGVADDKKKYLPADTAIRHLIPNLKNKNDGIGADPQGVTNVPNQYAEYKIEYSMDNKLMIYELKGIALLEHLAEYNKTPADKTFGKKELYTVEPAGHARAVIKLDNSSYWHYCDSNSIYFAEGNLRNIFYNSKSIVDYFMKYQNSKPVNHADLLMYELVN